MANKEYNEFDELITPFAYHPRVLEMRLYKHHGINRYDHCFRVAYHTYKITKLLGLNYWSATKAAFLHDFFLDEVQYRKPLARFREHPKFAVANTRKYFGLTAMEEDIIKTHMFPVTFTPPKYLESWIVDMIDDVASVYERCISMKPILKPISNVLLMLVLSIRK